MGGRLACCVSTLCLLVSAVCAQTPPGFYASGMNPPLSADNSAFRSSGIASDNTPQLASSQATGYDFGGFRTEVERYRSFGLTDSVSGAQVETNSVMLNGMYDIPSGQRIKPFVGAGFGAVNTRQNIPGASSNAWESAYQVRGGVSYTISKAMRGLLEIRQTGGLFAGSSPKVSFKQRGIVLGLKYQLQ